MSFYEFDTNKINEELTPPQLRRPRQLSWLNVLSYPLQWLRDWFFDTYIGGANYATWSGIVFYSAYERVIHSDGCVYEAMVANVAKNPSNNPDTWYKLQDTFIGVDERLKYNSQIIVYEYALNRWFRNIGATDQIYIVNNETSSDSMLLANTSNISSLMANDPAFSQYYMGNTYSPSAQYDYTIMFPAALFATLGATVQDQENAVRNIANKYNMAGMSYNIITY